MVESMSNQPPSCTQQSPSDHAPALPPQAAAEAPPVPLSVNSLPSSYSVSSFTSAQSVGRETLHSAHASPGNATPPRPMNDAVVQDDRKSKAVTETSEEDAMAASVLQANTRAAIIGYFGYMFGGAAINAYFGLIFAEKKFGTEAIGVLLAIVPFFNVALLPLVSYAADKFRCSTAILAGCAVASTLSLAVYCIAAQPVVVVVSFILFTAFQTPMNPLLDRHTLMVFPAHGRSVAWGYVRSFGAYGWGVGNPVAAGLVSLAKTWSVVVAQYLIGQLALLHCMWKTTTFDAPHEAPVHWRDIATVLLSNLRLVDFLFASCMMGMGYSFVNNFLFIFLNEIGGSKMLMGLTLLLTVSTEIPIFRCSDFLYRWFTYRQMMCLAMAIWSARVIGYSFLVNPWLVLLLEPLHGVTFALMWLPGIKALHLAFPPQLASSATGVLFTFVGGIGPIFGNLAAGKLYKMVGPRWMFRDAAAAMFVGLVIYVVADVLLERAGHRLVAAEDEIHKSGATDENDPASRRSLAAFLPSSVSAMEVEDTRCGQSCASDVLPIVITRGEEK